MSTSKILFEFMTSVTFFAYILKTGKHAVLRLHVTSLRYYVMFAVLRLFRLRYLSFSRYYGYLDCVICLFRDIMTI